MSSNISSNFPEDGTDNCQLRLGSYINSMEMWTVDSIDVDDMLLVFPSKGIYSFKGILLVLFLSSLIRYNQSMSIAKVINIEIKIITRHPILWTPTFCWQFQASMITEAHDQLSWNCQWNANKILQPFHFVVDFSKIMCCFATFDNVLCLSCMLTLCHLYWHVTIRYCYLYFQKTIFIIYLYWY